MIDRKPNLAGYARASYLRELHGDLDGAVEAMRLAVDAGGPAAENGAYVERLLGELERRRGHRAAARRAFGQALALVPGHPGAELGLARLDARRRRGCGRSSTRLPLPEYVIALGEAELAAGRKAAGADARARRRRAAPAATRRASTPTSSSPSSRPTTATRSARSHWRAAVRTPRRAPARRTRSAGR